MPKPPPDVVPLFPLTGSLLLPGNWLPLNVFEPRYRNMVEDAMAGDRYIGLIQPFTPQADNWPPSDHPSDHPELYRVGCAGSIEQCEPQADGRFLILLKGVNRFALREELPLHRGYRRAAVDYGDYAGDPQELEIELDGGRLLRAVKSFGKAQGFELDWSLLSSLPGVPLLNGLAVALPFQPAEKQALLEARGPQEREELLLALIGMGFDPLGGGDTPMAPQMVN